MEQPKYYTPSLTEFHEGFEFELAVYSHKMVKLPPTWKKQTYKIGMALQKDGNPEDKWRVKCLEPSDFEALGLELISNNIDYMVFDSSEGWRIVYHKDFIASVDIALGIRLS